MKTEKRRIIYSMVASLALGTMAVNAADIEQILPTVDDAFTVDSNGTERMRVNGDGHVGIGTAAPGHKFTVLLDSRTRTASDQQIISTFQVNQRLADGSFDNARTLSAAAIDDKMGIFAGYHHGTTDLTLGTYRHKEAIVVEDMTGRVGIGTTAPTEELNVIGDVLGKALMSGLVDSTGASDHIRFSRHGIGLFDNSKDYMLLKSKGDGASGINKLIFSFDPAAGGDQDLMTILKDGNVGIGTTVPTSKLAVVGLPVFADNTAAAALTAGDFYRTATGVLMVKF